MIKALLMTGIFSLTVVNDPIEDRKSLVFSTADDGHTLSLSCETGITALTQFLVCGPRAAIAGLAKAIRLCEICGASRLALLSLTMENLEATSAKQSLSISSPAMIVSAFGTKRFVVTQERSRSVTRSTLRSFLLSWRAAILFG